MTKDILLENFDLLADTPGGVQKLRELILQMAVQGRLVPQDPEEEPASVLLERIKEEKKRLVKEGKIKKQKSLPPIEPDEVPFELPEGWEWTRLGEATSYGLSEKINPELIENNVWVLELEDIEKVTSKILQEKYSDERKPKSTKAIFRTGDVIYCKLRPYLDKVIIANKDGVCTTEMIPLNGFDIINNNFIRWFLKSPAFITYANKSTHGMNLPRLGTDKARLAPMPLPPISEQKRIVAKVNQLMALCDDLENKKENQKTIHTRLNKSALHNLRESNTSEELTANWTRVKNNFNHLFTSPESIQELRSTILQLAVQGKLVSQDPKAPPANELLQQIKEEKKRLVKEGKLKKSKPLPEIKQEEMPFELPNRWVWANLGEVVIKLIDGTHHSPPNSKQGKFKYVTAKNIKDFGIDLNGLTYVTKEVHDNIYSRCNPEFGDILYIKDGATTGIATINNLQEQFSMLSSVALLKVPKHILNRYLLYVLRSPFFFESMRGDMSGVAITRVTLSKMNKAPVPIPPLNEQQRIAAKVDRLIGLCDEIETKLFQSNIKEEKLMEAVLAQLSESNWSRMLEVQTACQWT